MALGMLMRPNESILRETFSLVIFIIVFPFYDAIGQTLLKYLSIFLYNI